MNIAIIDDEKEWRIKTKEVVIQNLKSMKHNASISVYSSGDVFLQDEKTFDMVFMDIEMNGTDGFETTQAYKKCFPKCLVCILTTHSELSRLGYRVDAFRYINKDSMVEEISEALSSGIKVLGKNKKIAFHVVNVGEIQLPINEILYIETIKRNVRIYTREQEYLSNRTITSFEKELHTYGFYSVHKSTLVNLDAITSIDTKKRELGFPNGKSVTIAGKKMPEVKQKYLEIKFMYANG